MPKVEDHLQQANRNDRLSENLQGGDYPEWAVTTLFYSAVHLIDAFFAKANLHPSNHKERGEFTGWFTDLRAIYAHYYELKTRSEDARYRCLHFSAEQAQRFRDTNYAPLKTHVERILEMAPER